MPAKVQESSATIHWLTRPPEGTPRLTVGSHSFPALPLAIDPEAEHPLSTSPGELLAGAFGSIFAWSMAEELMREGIRASELVVEVCCSAEMPEGGDDRDIRLRGIDCRVEVRRCGLDPHELQTVSGLVRDRCVNALGLSDRIQVTAESTAVG